MSRAKLAGRVLVAASMAFCAGAAPGETEQCHVDRVHQKRAYYKARYPDMLFLVFKGGADAITEMSSLYILLGEAPASLDYEHPPKLRQDLMAASEARLWLMLDNQIPSATLFKADRPLDWPETLCVITLNACVVARNDRVATRYLVDRLPDESGKIPRHHQLRSEDYIDYVFDHEAYHCLKSRFYGPQTMSSRELWGEYNHFHEEKGADVYALAMHIKMHGGQTSFPGKLKRLRGMSLYNADPNHLTGDAIEELLGIPLVEIVARESRAMLELATEIKLRLTLDYDSYLRYLVSAMAAIEHLGAAELLSQEQRDKVQGLKPDPQLVDKLVQDSRRSARELAGELHE